MRASIGLLLILLVSFSQFAAAQVKVNVYLHQNAEQPGAVTWQKSYELSQSERISNVYERILNDLNAEDLAQINWSASRLSSDFLQARLERHRERMVEKLDQLARHWNRQDEQQVADSIKRLAAQVSRWPLQATYSFNLKPDQTRLILQQNPLLTRADGRVFNWHLYSFPHKALTLGLPEDLAGVDSDFLWRALPNGTVAKQPVAYYNQRLPAACYQHDERSPMQTVNAEQAERCAIKGNLIHSVRLLSEHWLTDETKQLDLELMLLAKFILPNGAQS
ncbi:capsule biosynthesis protein GfcC [Idiomarina fontislapidosi]|uniref:Capsule biosynthesis GfcC-like N-terminal domain-containing protein n=1 Tax=Idiomarina fontislapidosi TaxID=263723 RepID=A0A432XQZ6_9GAMM|nr:capsule biosynthesis GfcC D2 domain-containing protein [Idiomarina fontislapidosi]PYE30704.1 capsule biosynthesis protein GfcC [Idiomarina fontislapidosi]RUO51128.1 hypothetical protein CWE25_12020 [Idiomarina fontislapidosi]